MPLKPGCEKTSPFYFLHSLLPKLGQIPCDSNVQGIFITLEKSVSSLLKHSNPLSTYILSTDVEPVRLAILVSLSGGKQTKIVNMKEVKRFLKDLSSLIPKVQNFLHKAKSTLPEVKFVTEDSLEVTQQLDSFIQEMEMVDGEEINVTRALTLLDYINSKIEYFKKVISSITPMAISRGDVPLLRVITEVQPVNFPKPLDVQLGGEKVKMNFQGISFYLRTNLCIGQLCLNDLNTTVDCLAERNCVSNAPHLTMFRAKGKALNAIPLSDGNILKLPTGQIIDMVFPRDSNVVSAHFVGEARLFGVTQSINVTLDKKQLSFQMYGEIFDKYMANMTVIANTKHALYWRSLSFTVDGTMASSSLLSKSLQARVNNYAKNLAEKAAKRVQNCEKYILLAKQKVDSTKNLVEEKSFSLNKAEMERRGKGWELQKIYNKYKSKKADLDPSLTQFVKLMNNKTCEIQNCSYIVTNTCIPAVCQEDVLVNYTVPNCRKEKRMLVKHEVVPIHKEEVEKVVVYTEVEHSTCLGEKGGGIVAAGMIVMGTGGVLTSFNPVAGAIVAGVGGLITFLPGLIESMVGCDSYTVRVPAGIALVKHKVTANKIKNKTVPIDEFKCDKPRMESVISGYKTPKECCKNEVSGKIKVLDPNCISHNVGCLKNMSLLNNKIKFLNKNLFEEIRDMRNEGEQVTVAQLEANKARINYDLAKKQSELARACLEQNEFASQSINCTRVTIREKLGLSC